MPAIKKNAKRLALRGGFSLDPVEKLLYHVDEFTDNEMGLCAFPGLQLTDYQRFAKGKPGFRARYRTVVRLQRHFWRSARFAAIDLDPRPEDAKMWI